MADYARQFSELQEKKFAIEEQLANVEKELYDLEGTYLEETLEMGNILLAAGNKAAAAAVTGGTTTLKKGKKRDNDD